MKRTPSFSIWPILCLLPNFPAAAAVILTANLEPSAGGFLADDNGDGVFDRALPGKDFVVGGGGGSWDSEYQGSYEFDLAILGQDLQIISATLNLTRTGITGYVTGTPHILGEVGSYVADGIFSLNDVGAGTSIGTFNVWNLGLKPWPHPYSAFKVTSTLRSFYEGEDRILGFNFRSTSLPTSGNVTNGFNRPTLYLQYTVIPEPSTVVLAMLGILIAFRRNRFQA